MKLFKLLPGADWTAIALFFGLWIAYAFFARHWSARRGSLLATTNQLRAEWLMRATARDPRMLDGLITQSLSNTPSFFCSTTILIIGGLCALLGTTDKAAELVREIPFAQPTAMLVFEFKILMLIAVFVYAFFRFSWSMRQYTFVALLIGSMPPPEAFERKEEDAHSYAQRASGVVSGAAESFNDGLRAYYFSFALMAWFFSPVALVVATAAVVFILYNREFHSNILRSLRD